MISVSRILQWLSIALRIKSEYFILQNLTPVLPSDLILHQFFHSLHLTDFGLLLLLGQCSYLRAFAIAVSSTWNALPQDICLAHSFPSSRFWLSSHLL
jgi:hypothetical protein